MPFVLLALLTGLLLLPSCRPRTDVKQDAQKDSLLTSNPDSLKIIIPPLSRQVQPPPLMLAMRGGIDGEVSMRLRFDSTGMLTGQRIRKSEPSMIYDLPALLGSCQVKMDPKTFANRQPPYLVDIPIYFAIPPDLKQVAQDSFWIFPLKATFPKWVDYVILGMDPMGKPGKDLVDWPLPLPPWDRLWSKGADSMRYAVDVRPVSAVDSFTIEAFEYPYLLEWDNGYIKPADDVVFEIGKERISLRKNGETSMTVRGPLVVRVEFRR